MLPLFEKNHTTIKRPILRPLIEIIFENLYDSGFRKFCFVIGKTKNSIANHLLPDPYFTRLLKKRDLEFDNEFIMTINRVSKKIKNSTIKWVTQETPMGFGDALLSAKKFVGTDTFLLHAGDAYFPSYKFLPAAIKKFKTSPNVSGMLFLQRKTELRGYGIAQIKKQGKENIVFNVEEKPKKPLSNLVILPLYLFKSNIFDALKRTLKGYNGELQLTDAIRTVINDKEKILYSKYTEKYWADIGIPQHYHEALNISYRNATRTIRFPRYKNFI